MKLLLTLILLLSSYKISYSQEHFTTRKGSRFFPGHLDAQITLDSNTLRYELFNHWYSWAYAELRQLTIPIDSLDVFNNSNDSISIQILGDKIKLVDKKYKLKRKIGNRNLCTSVENMRKISYAYKISSNYDSINHFDLYERTDLLLTEDEFKKKVLANFEEAKITHTNNR